jgi:hypothetical protein
MDTEETAFTTPVEPVVAPAVAPEPTEPTEPVATVPAQPPQDEDNDTQTKTDSDSNSDSDPKTETDGTEGDDDCIPYPECPPQPPKEEGTPLFIPITTEICPVISVLVNKPKFCVQNKANTESCYFKKKK